MHFFLKQGNSVLVFRKICDFSLLLWRLRMRSVKDLFRSAPIHWNSPMVIHKNSTTLLLLHYQHASNCMEKWVCWRKRRFCLLQRVLDRSVLNSCQEVQSPLSFKGKNLGCIEANGKISFADRISAQIQNKSCLFSHFCSLGCSSENQGISFPCRAVAAPSTSPPTCAPSNMLVIIPKRSL